MKLTRRLEMKPRLRTRDVVRSKEEEDKVVAEFRRVLIPHSERLLADVSAFVRSTQNAEYTQASYNLARGISDLRLAGQLIGSPIIPPELEQEAQQAIRFSNQYLVGLQGKSPSQMAKVGSQKVLLLSYVVENYPEERNLFTISDAIFDQWLSRFSADKTALDTFKAFLFFRMATLRPDRLADCRRQYQLLERKIWERRAAELGNQFVLTLDALAAARVLGSEHLDTKEKDLLLERLNEVEKLGPLSGKPEVFADAAILLAPEVEITRQGQVKLSKGPQSMGSETPLPERSI